MGKYQFVIDSDAPNLIPQNEYVEIKTSDLEQVKNTQTQDTDYNPLKLKSSFTKLHSLMQNNFYEPLETQLTVELQQHLEKINSLNFLYTSEKYLGEQDEFLTRITYLFRLLNIKPPVSFLSYLKIYYYTEDFVDNSIESDNTNLVNRWYRDILHSNYIMKKYIGTISLYEFIFKSFYRFGSATIRSKYINVGIFTPFTNKYFKLLDFFGKGDLINISTLNHLLPTDSKTKWPNSVNFFGIKEINDLKSLDYYKYDTGRIYDDGVIYSEDVPPVPSGEYFNFDTGIPLGVSGSGLVLDICADYVMHHVNSLFHNECIMDNPWLDYISEFAKKAKRASDQIMVGTQVSLVASNTGQYISDPNVQKVNDEFFTHPNIKAKFQVIKENFDANRNISYVRLGTSTYDDGVSNVFADHTVDPSTCNVPSDVKSPTFEMSVGQYEVNELNNYINLNIMVHRNSFTKQELRDQTLNIAQAYYPSKKEYIAGEEIDASILPVLVCIKGDGKVYRASKNISTGRTNVVGFIETGIILENSSVEVLQSGKISGFSGLTSDVSIYASGTDIEATWGTITQNTSSIDPDDDETINIGIANSSSMIEVKVVPAYSAPTTTISFPHKTLSIGSCIFKIELILKQEDNTDTKRYILIKEIYNTSLKKYVPILFYLDENQYKLSSDNIDVLVDITEDSEYSFETTYFPSLTDNLIRVLPYETVEDITTFCKIDHTEGTLSLKMMVDDTSKLKFISLYNGTGTVELNSKIECSYTTNSIRSLNSATNNISALVGITEIGIFNTNNNMIAYGTFPYIIYDTSNYHVTFNCLMEQPVIEEED
jgi:hypothetical protein